MGIKIIEGNILDTDRDIIVQQVNCLGVMGAGLAKTILGKYPKVKKEYVNFCRKERIPEYLLGKVHYVQVYDGKEIANVFGQLSIRKNQYDKAVYTNTKALITGIDEVRKKAEIIGQSVAIPSYIGCNLAGGDWEEIRWYIEKVFEDSAVDVAFYNYR